MLIIHRRIIQTVISTALPISDELLEWVQMTLLRLDPKTDWQETFQLADLEQICSQSESKWTNRTIDGVLITDIVGDAVKEWAYLYGEDVPIDTDTIEDDWYTTYS